MPSPTSTPDAASAFAAAIPLRDRLPNAPAEFVGRTFERERLKKLLQRARVAVVWGMAGLGKTALVLDVLHRHFAARVPRTIYVSLRPEREDVRVRVVRALAGASPVPEPDWTALLADPDNLLATAIDLADTGDYWVVLDDVQWADAAQLAQLLTQLGRFARRARWIAASRVDPGVPELAEHTLALAPMAPADLAKLAAAWAGRRPRAEVRKALESAAGSPWRLRRALFGSAPATASGDSGAAGTESAAAEGGDADPLAGMPDSARALVAALGMVEQPVAAEALATLGAAPAPEVILALERRGLLERTPRGLRLPDVARSLLAAAARGARVEGLVSPLRVADALVTQDDPSAVLEGLRLMALQRRSEDALRVLAGRGAALLAGGYAPDLWRALVPCGDEPRLSRWRLRCTVEFDSPAVLAAVAEQVDPAPDDRLAWAQVLFRRGRIDAAERAAGAALDAARAAGDDTVALDAAVLRARAVAQQGREAEALSSIQGLRPTGESARARLDALSAMLLTALDRRDEARALLVRLRAGLAALPTPAQLEVGFGVVQALYFLGQYGEADEAIRDLVARTGETALALSHGRRLLYYRASIAIERGRLAEAGELLARLQAFADGRSMFRTFVDFAEATRMFAAGEFGALEALLPRVLAGGAQLGEWNPHHVEAVLLAARVSALTGHPPLAVIPEDDSLPPAGGYPARPRVGLARVAALVRAGQALDPAAWPAADALPAWGDTRGLALTVRAQCALVGDDLEAAREAAEGALREAAEGGSALAAAEAHALIAEVHAARGDAAEVARAAALLHEFGARAPSARYVADAALFTAAGFAGRPEPAVLEKLAADALGGAPVTTRRARALLTVEGHVPGLDALDRRFVAAAKRAWGRGTLERVGGEVPAPGEPWRPGWGLDVPRMEVWLPGAAGTVALRDRGLLWKVLLVLAERGGRAGKEDLVVSVWSEREYHPLRHDNRLRLAVRKLRQLLERDAAAPELVFTLEDGYALGGVARWLR